MVDRKKVKADVVAILDGLSPLELARLIHDDIDFWVADVA